MDTRESSAVEKTWLLMGGGHVITDTISHAGKLWLVPEWFEYPAQKLQMPVRIIRLDQLQHSVTPVPPFQSHYLLQDPLPKPVFDGETTLAEGIQYEVVEAPQIRISMSELHH